MTEPLPPFVDPDELAIDGNDQVAFATGRIRSYCRWHIYPLITSTVTLDTDGSLLMLPSLHVTDITSVTRTADGVVISAGDYSWSAAGMIAARYGWPQGFRSVQVVFTHGYDYLPDELREVAVSAASRVPATLSGVSQETAGGVSRTYSGLLSGTAAVAAGWTFAEQQVLDKYRIPSRP